MEVVWVLLAAALFGLLVRLRFSRVVVFEYERGLEYSKGSFRRVLGPGRHWVYTPTRTVRKVDIRQRVVTVPGQEVLTSDGVTVKLSLAATFEIAQPEIAVNKTQDFFQALYVTLQLALRRIVSGTGIEELLAERARIAESLMELSREPVADLGLNLLSVDLKDLMFPGELKKIFSQVAQAKQEGLAALERARGETAALRNLANAARLAGDNPALLQLRLIQQIGGSSGNSVVLGFPAATQPLPIKQGEVPDARELPAGTEGEE